MGYEKTAPKNMIIFVIGIGSAVTLVALQFVFMSYFTKVRAEKNFEQILGVPAVEYSELKADALQRLASGRTSITEAVAAVSSGARPAEVAPNLEDDNLDALSGWAQTPAPKRVIFEAKRRRLEYLVRGLTARIAAARTGEVPADAGTLAQLDASLAQRKQELAELLGQKPAPEPGDPVLDDTVSADAPPVPEGAAIPPAAGAGSPAAPVTTGADAPAAAKPMLGRPVGPEYHPNPAKPPPAQGPATPQPPPPSAPGMAPTPSAEHPKGH